MGQQLPFYHAGQAAGDMFNAYVRPALPNTTEVMNAAMPIADPNMMAQAQQQLANPNANDSISFLPSPEAMAMGAGAGVATVFGLKQLMGKPGEGKGATLWIADTIEKIPGVRSLSQKLEERLANTKNQPAWFKEFMLSDAAGTSGKADVAIRNMEKRQLESTLKDFKRLYAPDKNGKQSAFAKELETQLKSLESNWKGEKLTFDEVIGSLESKLGELGQKEGRTGVDKKVHKKLFNLKERVSGLRGFYKPIFESQAHLTQALGERKIGPIGRSVASSVNYLIRIFSGETMTKGVKEGASQTFMQKAGTVLSKCFGPILAGSIIFGQSIDKAKKADDGEKKKAFFHDFFGSGLGNFIGWEIGRKFLHSVQFSSKIFGKAASKTLPRMMFGRAIPIIGAWTLGGFATELAAMFLFGSIFQKGAEAISHAIFGKPSQKTLDINKGKQQGQKLQQGMAAQQGYGLPGQQAPNTAATTGAYPYQAGPAGSPQAAANPYGAYQANAYPSNVYQTAQAHPYAPQQNPQMSRAIPPVQQRFSISPEMIRQSPAAQSYANMQQHIVNQNQPPQTQKNRNIFLPQ